MQEDQRIYCNGIDSQTGGYLLPPLGFAEAARLIGGIPVNKQQGRSLSQLVRASKSLSLGLSLEVDASKPESGGWAVVFHRDEGEAVKKEVMRLYEHRRKQIGDDSIVKVLEYAGEPGWLDWLAKYRVGAGNVTPWRVPYYLLLVGVPERIPFDFCQMLSLEYAVGLLHFDDAIAYGRYVDSVIAYEGGDAPPRSKEAIFFRTNYDRATKLSAEQLVTPLADGVPTQYGEPAQEPVAESTGFVTRRIWDGTATASALAEVFAPPTTRLPPAFLFSATHGVGFIQPTPDEQPVQQGALKCQDSRTFSADFLAATPDVRVHGLIAFLFASYSAGTPQFDQYVTHADRTPLQIAEQPFLAALPQTLLSHPQGGALACIGHVGRAWGFSVELTPESSRQQLLAFRNAIRAILRGRPVGHAMRIFFERYASMAVSLNSILEEMKFGARFSGEELVMNWLERNANGTYALIGDPAVRLHVEDLV